MEFDSPGSVTELLHVAAQGDRPALDRLWSAVYEELRRRARREVTREGSAGMQATSLVHEAYLRLVGDGHVEWANRRHFFGAAAEAMRRIRVDDARKRNALKRGAGQRPEPLESDPLAADADPAELLGVDESLRKLEQLRPRSAEVVKLRYFAGLSVDETAAALGVSARTVDTEWRFARAWLHRELSGRERPPSPFKGEGRGEGDQTRSASKGEGGEEGNATPARFTGGSESGGQPA